MGLSRPRRFLNLIMEGLPAARSLRRIDLERLQLFHDHYPPAAASTTTSTTTMGSSSSSMIVMPDHTFRFEAHCRSRPRCFGGADFGRIACYPFGQAKVLSTDQLGRNLLYDVSTREVAVMPSFREPKLHGYLSLFVPASRSGIDDDDDHHDKDDDDDDDEDEDDIDFVECQEGSLYLMARDLREVRTFGTEEAGQPSEEFQVVFYGHGRTTSHCKLLPLPPFVPQAYGPNERRPKVRSYAVVGSRIVVSVDGKGTYAMDTASHEWSKVGDWTLPFHGKVEYEPELKLWFGISGDAADADADGKHLSLALAAADLSAMDDAQSPPQLAAGGEEEWVEMGRPEEWADEELSIRAEDVQLVSLGSGRFCVARFFMESWDRIDSAVSFVVLTGVQVVPRVLASGEVKLEMIPRRSMYYDKNLRIHQFF